MIFLKRELSLEEQEAEDKMFAELVGFNLEQAERILKSLAARVKESAIIEGERQ